MSLTTSYTSCNNIIKKIKDLFSLKPPLMRCMPEGKRSIDPKLLRQFQDTISGVRSGTTRKYGNAIRDLWRSKCKGEMAHCGQ